jgi:predicted RNA-binding Zn ribbon-like protein
VGALSSRLLLTHNGGAVDADAVAALESASRDARVRVSFAPDGAPRMEPAGAGADAVLARLVTIAARSDADGTWPRLKACGSGTCMWVFYDRSRNRSRTWCSMSACGNRAKARRFRAPAAQR